MHSRLSTELHDATVLERQQTYFRLMSLADIWTRGLTVTVVPITISFLNDEEIVKYKRDNTARVPRSEILVYLRSTF